MARKVSDQATLQKQADQEAGILLTFLPFTKKTSSSPAWLGAILHTFPTSLQQGHRAALWEQPYSPEQSEHQPHHRWPESASTTFDFHPGALWEPILYKRCWRGVPAACGWCSCSPNDSRGAGSSRVTRPLLYSRGSQFSCIPFGWSCQAWGIAGCHQQGIHRGFAMQCKLQGREGAFSQLSLTKYWQEKAVSLVLCTAIHLAFTTQRSPMTAPAYLKTPWYVHICC